jgi:hypothetical protein
LILPAFVVYRRVSSVAAVPSAKALQVVSVGVILASAYFWPVTVALADAETLLAPDVPEGVAVLVVVALIVRVLVSVALALGLSGP